MVGGHHENQSLTFVNGVEEPIIPNAVPPSIRDGIPQLLDVLSRVRVEAQLGIDVRGELALDPGLLPAEVLLEVALELGRFENAKLSQRACPFAAWRRDAPRAAWPSGVC